MRTQTK